MKVTMKVALSGSRDGQDWPGIGETVDLPDDEAQHYCDIGIAEPATHTENEGEGEGEGEGGASTTESSEVESATVDTSDTETATTSTTPSRRRRLPADQEQ